MRTVFSYLRSCTFAIFGWERRRRGGPFFVMPTTETISTDSKEMHQGVCLVMLVRSTSRASKLKLRLRHVAKSFGNLVT